MSKRLIKKLIDGFDVHERRDGKVLRVRAEGHPVAEVVVGAETVRVNFREKPNRLPEGLFVGGKSKSWPGGGVQVTDENAEKVKELLQEAVECALSDGAAPNHNGHVSEVIEIPVRRRGRKMAETTVTEVLDGLEIAEKEGILDEVFSSDIAYLLSRRLNAARARRQSRSEAEATR